MPSLIKQRLIGLLLIIGCGGYTAYLWDKALTEGVYYRKASVLFPAFAVLGLGMLLFPIDREWLMEQYGVEKPQSLSQYTPSWYVVMALALAAGFGNLYLISQ